MTCYEELVQLRRGGLIESVHSGAIVFLDADGEIDFSLGEVEETMYPRSTSKLFQAAALIELGLEVSVPSLALIASSHSGSDRHVASVLELLHAFGLSADDLQCTPGLPVGPIERRKYLADGGAKNRLRGDCSGKHAGFLATCVVNNWDLATYLDPQHPLQLQMRAVVERLTAEPAEFSSVDGCGAPLWSTTLLGLAQGYRTACISDTSAAVRQVADAMRGYPELVGGPGREATEAMFALGGVLAKDGAEGVFAMAHSDGRAVAIKIGDGNKRALSTILNPILLRWGAGPDDLHTMPESPVLGGGAPVGQLELAAPLAEYL